MKKLTLMDFEITNINWGDNKNKGILINNVKKVLGDELYKDFKEFMQGKLMAVADNRILKFILVKDMNEFINKINK